MQKHKNLIHSNYKALACSLILHTVFFLFVLFGVTNTSTEIIKTKQSFVNNKSVIKSSVISSAALDKEIKQVKQERLAKAKLQANQARKLKELKAQSKKQNKQLSEYKQKIDLQKKTLVQRNRAISTLTRKKEVIHAKVSQQEKNLNQLTQRLAQKSKQLQAIETKIKQSTLLRKKQEKLAQRKLMKRKAAQIKKKKLLQEKQNAKHLAQLKIIKIKEFSNLIRIRVSRVWSLKKADPEKESILIVRLNKKGEVVRINLAKSSGESSIDNSAIIAVHKAAPFPIPAVLNIKHYIDLRLTLSPKGIVT